MLVVSSPHQHAAGAAAALQQKEEVSVGGCCPSSADADAMPILRVQAGPSSTSSSSASTSEEPEGGSPTSLQLLSGSHAARHQQHNKRRGRWVLRQLLRKQQQSPEELAADAWVVSGSSYDSLVSLEEQCSEEQPYHQLAAADTCALLDQPATAAITSSSSSATQQHGLVGRCVRAVLRPVVRAVCSAARALASNAGGPQGPGTNDNSMAERVINVLTSLPFFAVGLHGLRARRCPKGRHFALSFLALGAAATGYHGADRASWLRPIMRKADYFTILYTSTQLRRAAHIPLPGIVKAAAVLVAPFKPSVVTGLNLALVEGKFLKSALAHTHLRSSFKAHIGSAALGMVCFAYEDIATEAGWPPVLHSLWHCLSALAMGALHGLLQHLELAVLVEGVQMAAASR